MLSVDEAGGLSLLDEGMYPAELLEIKDIETEYGDSLRWIFGIEGEETEEGEMPEVSGITSRRMSEKSKAFGWSSALSGIIPEVGDEVDLDDLIGMMGQVELKTGSLRDGTEVSNVIDVKSLPKKKKGKKKPAEDEKKSKKKSKRKAKRAAEEEEEEEEEEGEEDWEGEEEED